MLKSIALLQVSIWDCVSAKDVCTIHIVSIIPASPVACTHSEGFCFFFRTPDIAFCPIRNHENIIISSLYLTFSTKLAGPYVDEKRRRAFKRQGQGLHLLEGLLKYVKKICKHTKGEKRGKIPNPAFSGRN